MTRKQPRKDVRKPRRVKHSNPSDYESAIKLALSGDFVAAKTGYELLLKKKLENRLRSRVTNDLAAIAAMEYDFNAAAEGFAQAISLWPDCHEAGVNQASLSEITSSLSPSPAAFAVDTDRRLGPPVEGPTRIAFVSSLFCWPSTGGGVMCTVEMSNALSRAGYEVRHFFPRYDPWGIGVSSAYLPVEFEQLVFREAEWRRDVIQGRFREAVDLFNPHCVVVSDSWNFKPWLADAMQGLPYLLFIQALETLCPLNNSRLLVLSGAQVEQCDKNQLAAPNNCYSCLVERGHTSGGLHSVERQLSAVGSAEYDEAMRRSFRAATAVVVSNPDIEAMIALHANKVIVSPSAIDSSRFPWPPPVQMRPAEWSDRKVVFYSGKVDDPIKGFQVLQEACRLLWNHRHDFLLLATGDPAGPVNDYLAYSGWLSQDELPFLYYQAYLCVVPSIYQEAFGRVAAEAMAAGKPVVASRIGGLPFVVGEEATGLLFEPSNPTDLAAKIERLLDDSELCARLGQEGRRQFEERFTWDVVLPRDIEPILKSARASVSGVST